MAQIGILAAVPECINTGQQPGTSWGNVMDMATLMSMFGGGQGGQPTMQAGMQPSTEPGGMGFGLGQQMMQQGQPGQGMQYAPQGPQDTGMMAQLQQMFAGQGGQGQPGAAQQDPNGLAAKLGPLAQMMAQQQQQGQPQQMGPMAGMHGQQGQMGQTQASRGYLAQGGGIQPRRIIGQGM